VARLVVELEQLAMVAPQLARKVDGTPRVDGRVVELVCDVIGRVELARRALVRVRVRVRVRARVRVSG